MRRELDFFFDPLEREDFFAEDRARLREELDFFFEDDLREVPRDEDDLELDFFALDFLLDDFFEDDLRPLDFFVAITILPDRFVAQRARNSFQMRMLATKIGCARIEHRFAGMFIEMVRVRM